MHYGIRPLVPKGMHDDHGHKFSSAHEPRLKQIIGPYFKSALSKSLHAYKVSDLETQLRVSRIPSTMRSWTRRYLFLTLGLLDKAGEAG